MIIRYYNYKEGDFNFISTSHLQKTLKKQFPASNSSEWAESWIQTFILAANKQKEFFLEKTNFNRFNDYFAHNSPEIYSFGHAFDSQDLTASLYIDAVLTTFRSESHPPLEFPTHLLTNQNCFSWKKTSDILIKPSNIGQPLLVFPLIEDGVHIIIDGNHRATKALLVGQQSSYAHFINRKEFFKHRIYFPSDFDFFSAFFICSYYDLSLYRFTGNNNTIPKEFFPPKLPHFEDRKDHWGRDVFRLY